MAQSGEIPLRKFGKSNVQISALGLGGHHLGAAEDEATAVRMVHRAIEGGISFYDCCWEYNRGKSEDWLGKGLKGIRDRAFLMTKVCTHGRDASLAIQMLVDRVQSEPLSSQFPLTGNKTEKFAVFHAEVAGGKSLCHRICEAYGSSVQFGALWNRELLISYQGMIIP
jgi:hypothetical protein